MASQPKIVELFPVKKKPGSLQASKRRKVHLLSTNQEEETLTDIDPVSEAPPKRATRSAVKSVQAVVAPVKKPASKSKKKNATTTKISKNQTTLDEILDRSNVDDNKEKGISKFIESITASVDDHSSSPMSSPRKRGGGVDNCQSAATKVPSPKKRGRKSVKKDQLSELLKTPEQPYDFGKFVDKDKEAAESSGEVAVRKRLVLKKPSAEAEDAGVDDVDGGCSFGDARKAVQNSEKAADERCNVEKPVSYTPIRNKVIEMLAKTDLVKKASKSGGEKFKPLPSGADMKSKLAKCGKLHELQAKLARTQELTQKRNQRETEVAAEAAASYEKSAEEKEKEIPAYQRFHTLAVEVPPTLSLPYSYKVVAEFFRGTETITSMLHNRSEICSFAKLKKGVQELVRKTFETYRLGQIKTVYPAAYMFRQEKGLPSYPGEKHGRYELTVEPNLADAVENDPSGGKNRLRNKNGQVMFTGDFILKRKQYFHYSLVEIVKRHHREFLAKNFPRLQVPDDAITRWHPKFPVDRVAEVEAAALPQPPSVRVFKTAQDVLNEAKSGGKSLHPRIEQALAKVAASKSAPSASLSTGRSPTFKPKPNAALKGLSGSLLERIRAKEAEKISAQLMRDPKDDMKFAMLQRLPEMAKILRTVFVVEKKPALPVDEVHKKLADSYKTGMSALEVENHMKMIGDILPNWITIVETRKGSFMKVDKNRDIAALVNKIEGVIEQKRSLIAPL